MGFERAVKRITHLAAPVAALSLASSVPFSTAPELNFDDPKMMIAFASSRGWQDKEIHSFAQRCADGALDGGSIIDHTYAFPCLGEPLREATHLVKRTLNSQDGPKVCDPKILAEYGPVENTDGAYVMTGWVDYPVKNTAGDCVTKPNPLTEVLTSDSK
ncbi:MAG: hypothetical protein V4449_02310 [Patescibacteria group bacterium]